MDWWKLFGGTFVLIFLAELGDKTQLAALAKTADSPNSSMAKWVVFLGASAALVASTFVAVFLGHLLKALVPDERYIKLAAGTLFLIFGLSILYETHRSFKTREAKAGGESVRLAGNVGVVGGLALQAAVDFEELTRDGYKRLAGKAGPGLSELLLELAREEDSHLTHLREFNREELCDEALNLPGQACKVLPEGGVGVTEADEGVLTELVAQEEATARFYRDLAGRTLIPSVRDVFSHLASEEESHASRLRSFIRDARRS